jgi:hypothetical protein
MRKFFLFLLPVALFACNSNTEPKVESMSAKNDSAKTADVVYPYEVGYSSHFEIGDAQQAKMILEIWKDWDNGNVAAHKDYFADSVEMYFPDGSMVHSTRDSSVASAQAFRNNYTTVVSRVNAVTPLKSTDKNENWVCVWGMETHTDKKGKTDSVYLQETWRFNKSGKADLLYQFNALPVKK